MNQAFGKVMTRTWDDPHFRRLEGPARLLFLWSWTNPKAAVCGLYQATPAQMCRALGVPPDNPQRHARWQREMWEHGVQPALGQLAVKPMVLYDADACVLWVVNRARHALSSDRAAGLMRKEWRECPASPLRGKFAQLYGQALQLERAEVCR